VSKWKYDERNYNDPATPFVKAVVNFRTTLVYLLKFVNIPPPSSGEPAAKKSKKNGTTITNDIANGDVVGDE
jgi:hypothetical protein